LKAVLPLLLFLATGLHSAPAQAPTLKDEPIVVVAGSSPSSLSPFAVSGPSSAIASDSSLLSPISVDGPFSADAGGGLSSAIAGGGSLSSPMSVSDYFFANA